MARRRWWWPLGLACLLACSASNDEEAEPGGAAGRAGIAGAGGASPATASLWSKYFAGTSDRYLVAAAPAPGGGVVITGFFVGTIDLGGGPLSSGDRWASASPPWAVFVARLDGQGGHVWSKRFGGEGVAHSQSVAVDGKDEKEMKIKDG